MTEQFMAWKEKLERKDVAQKVDPNTLHNLLAEAIADLDAKGTSIMALSKNARHQTFLIEQQITEAVNAGDKLAFNKLLTEWKGYFN